MSRSKTFLKTSIYKKEDGEVETAGGEDFDAEKIVNLKKDNNGLGFSTQHITPNEGEDEDRNRRANFIENYGVEIKMPAFYSHPGVLVPHKKNFVISLGFHTIPRLDQQTVQVNQFSQVEDKSPKYTNETFNSMYYMSGNSVIMKLYEAQPRIGFKLHWEV